MQSSGHETQVSPIEELHRPSPQRAKREIMKMSLGEERKREKEKERDREGERDRKGERGGREINQNKSNFRFQQRNR